MTDKTVILKAKDKDGKDIKIICDLIDMDDGTMELRPRLIVSADYKSESEPEKENTFDGS